MPANTNQSRRGSDMSAESQMGLFLDKYLYKGFSIGKVPLTARRTDSIEEQLAGIDVKLIDKKGNTYNVDEKAQLYYLNRDLPTFAFEIRYLRGGVETLGWLCNKSLLTDLYLLIWPFAEQDTPKGIRCDQFTRADCLLIEKKALLDELEAQGLTIKKMLEDTRRIRAARKVGKLLIPADSQGGETPIPADSHGGKVPVLTEMYYFASDPKSYKESPINIVIRKSLLKKIAVGQYIVTPNGVSS